MKRIESRSNPLLKTIRRLGHPRRREPRFLLEGRKLVEAALASGTRLESALTSTAFRRRAPELLSVLEKRGVPIAEVEDSLFRDLSHLDSPEGILALAERPSPSLETLPEDGILAVACGIQDPGNLGAVARVCEATGIAALVAVKGSADAFGPKAVRGSMGSVLRVPVFEASDAPSFFECLNERGFRLAAALPRGGDDFRRVALDPPIAFVLGGESAGLDPETIARCDLKLTIPMKGEVESLNVATVAALLFYEATRRRF